MKEVEVKILEVNRKEVEKKLIELGAKKLYDRELHAVLFDDEDETLLKGENLLRLRKEGDKTILCFKDSVSKKDSKISKEYEIEVSDMDTAKKIIELMGFKTTVSLVKQRVTYKLDNVKFEFDKYKGEHEFIPELLEIESDDEHVLFEYAEKLGFKKKDCSNMIFTDLISYYKNKNL